MVKPNRLNEFFLNAGILLFGMLLCGMISIGLGKELNWDLANYHYYNPFSFLHERWKIDDWPMSFIHVHFTPTLDFLTYFLINRFPVKLTVFVMGALHGINLWLLFCIARSMLNRMHVSYPCVLALILAMLGLYGPTVLPGIGSFQHDELISLFILAFIYLQLRYWMSATRAWFLFITSSILLGIAVGCKLTAGLFVGGAGLTYLFMPVSRSSRLKILLLFAIGVAIGLLCSSGYWMLELWEKYRNPFFPFFNGIFHSPDFPPTNWTDLRFLPKNGLETFFFPFYFSEDGRTNDMPFCDYRFAMVYLLFILYGFLLFVRHFFYKKKMNLSISHDITLRWLFLFFIFSYVLWQWYFSIMRYIAVLEMLAPLIIYLLVFQLFEDAVIRFSMAVFLLILLGATMQPSEHIRERWYATDYFNVKLPAFVNHLPAATVLMAFPAYASNVTPRPQMYLIPFFPAHWQFIGIPFLKEQYQMPEKIIAWMQPRQNTIYLLSSSEYMPKMYSVAAHLNYKTKLPCGIITSDRQLITNEDVLLCPVKKQG